VRLAIHSARSVQCGVTAQDSTRSAASVVSTRRVWKPRSMSP
jgi:hypothetical protein